MMIPAKILTKHDTEFDSGIFTSARLHKRTVCREIYTVPVKSAANVIAEASSRVRPIDLCAAAGLDSSQLNDRDGQIPFQQLVALYETAASLTNEHAFGLHVGARTDFRAFDVFGYIIMNSATLGDALNNAVRYFPLWTNGALFRTERERAAMRFIWEYADPRITECRHDCEMTLLSAAKIGRFLLARPRAPREVHFQHPAPRDSSEHWRLFGASVHFRMPANQLIFDQDALASPLDNADHELCSILVRYANELLAQASHRRSFIERTQLTLLRRLRNGEPRLTKVASSMGVSARTLQRQLKAQGLSFRALLNTLRRELAEKYIHNPEIEISEIASLLGYAEASEFHRAFRAWTNTTPRQYRRAGVSSLAALSKIPITHQRRSVFRPPAS
jgi:AraC-like DNA-binding protein